MKHALALGLILVTVNLAPWTEALQFDRAAIADGELWRLVSGNAVHYSPGHLALDLAMVMAGAVMLGRRSWWMAGVAALTVGVGIFIFQQDLQIYRGLSGVSVALVTAAVLEQIVETRHPAFAAIGLALAAKLIFEMTTGSFIVGVSLDVGEMGAPTPLAHLFGGLSGILMIIPSLYAVKRWAPMTS